MSQIPLSVKAVAYAHQIEAFNFACSLFGLPEGGESDAGEVPSLWETNVEEAKPDKKEH